VRAQAIKTSKGDPSSLPKMLAFVAIRAARSTIQIQNPYFLPDEQLRHELVAAARRGVAVTVMVPGHHMDVPLVRMASRHDFGFEYQPTMMHSKVLIVDGVFSTVGSINFDPRSMSKNAENNVAVLDREFAGRLEAMFERDRGRCLEVTYPAWKERGFTARVAESFSRLFRPLY
jgi:cardiolipin synthase